MSKANKQRKADVRAAEDARKFTAGKVIRLIFKSLGFAILVGFLIVAIERFVSPLQSWMEIAIMLVIYLAAYPILMSEFRVKRPGR